MESPKNLTFTSPSWQSRAGDLVSVVMASSLPSRRPVGDVPWKSSAITALRSGWGLQAELAHFASTAMMNFTVSSSGDPQRDSCAMFVEVNPRRRKSASTKIGMIDANFMALVFCWVVFHLIQGQALIRLTRHKISDRARERG